MKKIMNPYPYTKMMDISIGFHDFEKSDWDVQGWIAWCQRQFQEYGLTPTRATIKAKDYEPTKTMSYRGVYTKTKKIPHDDIYELSFYANVPNHKMDVTDIFSSVYVHSKIKKNNYILNSCGGFVLNSSINYLTKLNIIEFIKFCLNYVKFKYGYIYIRNPNFGSSFYPFPVVIHPMERKYFFAHTQRDAMNQWDVAYNNSGPYKTGDFRDVYRGNILCPDHLSRQIEGQSLERWIEGDPTRGELVPIIEDRWLWWVPPTSLRQVQAHMKDAGLLLAPRPEEDFLMEETLLKENDPEGQVDF